MLCCFQGGNMKVFFSILLFSILLLLSSPIFAQQTSPEDDGVVKITTNLVQLDAIITDKNGNQVTNLKADEFEIFQDGKPQKITNFSYIKLPTQTTTSEPKPIAENKDKNAPLPPPVNINPASAGRILTFIIDDGNCTVSQVGMTASRQSLEKFVKEQMQPNDLIAIYRTRSGSSMLQQYTSDKSTLLQTIRKIRWYPPQGSCSTSDGSFFERSRSNSPSGIGTSPIESDEARKRREAGEDFALNNQIVGVIGVINYIVRGLDRVPGRKVVFFLSDGIPFRTRDGKFLSSSDVMRDLTDSANRASVVFNTIDVRGVFDPGFIEAKDEVDVSEAIDPVRPSGTSQIAANRQRATANSQDGLFFLANETGGRFFQGSNSFDGSFQKALSQESGYYLIGYEPEEETFKGKSFNKIEIKVKRPELKVISRSGFIGKSDTEKAQKPRTADSDLYQAIIAPLPKSGLNLRLTAFFGNTISGGNFVRSLINLSGNEITFTDDSNGSKKAVFDVIAVTLDEKNQVIDEFNKTHTLKVDENTAKLIKQNGLVYSADVPIKNDGTYNLRVAMRDANSKLLGSAGQSISVPNLKKGELFLSGMSISEVDAKGKFVSPSMTKPENGFVYVSSKSVPAVRQFKKGMILAYSYTLYNPKIDKVTNLPNLATQVNLYRDGILVSQGSFEKAKIENQPDLTRINDFGYLRINEAVPVGDYALQLIVKDLQTNQTVSQSIDFEVVN